MARNSPVEQGYMIARQDCFRCHNMGAEGGTKAGRSWLKLAARRKMARIPPDDPQSHVGESKGNHARSHPYDDATLDALTAYFKTFAPAGRNR
jgi:mono/diheme cytochrome c family protein